MRRASIVRFGVVGVGCMGRVYARLLSEGAVPRARLAAVCNRRPGPMEEFRAALRYADARELCRSGAVDAVLVATPHPAHVAVGIEALRAGLHVLVDKPLAPDLLSARRLLAAHDRPRRVFAILFNQRTDPRYRAVRALVAGGRLGAIRRVSWTATDWFRTEAYYRQRAWRGTWDGEGGGVLLNQAPHQLDLYAWIFGMPSRVRALCRFGKYHGIETEDEAAAIFEHADGLTGTFVASTGESPGSNRLEACGDHGRLILEGDRLTVETNRVPAPVFGRTSADPFGRPAVRRSVRRVAGRTDQHAATIRNFVRAVLAGRPLITPAEEGLRSLELANAMIHASVTGRAVDLPLDARACARTLRGLRGKPLALA
jgi:predicted dehydrogenase